MALEWPPQYLHLNPEGVKSYRPANDKVSTWHDVKNGREENFWSISAKHKVSIEKLIELNFPGSVQNGRVVPEIVNWYLHHHEGFGCPETRDRKNRIFRGGERIAIPRSDRPGQPSLPTLADVKKWYTDHVLPRRTVGAGFAANRTWKSPRGWVLGNVEDANGLCGDTSLFVAEEYYRAFKDYRTADGYIIGMVLWEGGTFEQNHIANVLMFQSRSRKETYTYNASEGRARAFHPPPASMRPPTAGEGADGSARGQYGTTALLTLWVFDLYYKKPPQQLGAWWAERDSDREGRLTIGLQHDFAE